MIALDLDWAELDRIITVLCGQVQAGGPPDVVVGVLRGGVVPAVMAAHRLSVRTVRAVEVTRTLSDASYSPKSAFPMFGDVSGLGELAGLDVLLIDDVAGSGATARAVTGLVCDRRPARLRRAVVVVNTENWAASNSRTDPFVYFDHVGTACSGWVRFPWERP